jgi:hypothetical protein
MNGAEGMEQAIVDGHEMNTIPSAANRTPGADWQLLGEIQLSTRTDKDDQMQVWLSQLVEPLVQKLPLFSKLLRSVDEAISHATAERNAEFEFVYLLVFIPANLKSEMETWGFFRIQHADRENTHPTFIINLYLYVEGA